MTFRWLWICADIIITVIHQRSSFLLYVQIVIITEMSGNHFSIFEHFTQTSILRTRRQKSGVSQSMWTLQKQTWLHCGGLEPDSTPSRSQREFGNVAHLSRVLLRSYRCVVYSGGTTDVIHHQAIWGSVVLWMIHAFWLLCLFLNLKL